MGCERRSNFLSATTFELEELLGTKLRALYQRKKGRDLFDLARALKSVPSLDVDKVVSCFTAYLTHEGNAISRAEFDKNLSEKIDDPTFYGDVLPLLATQDDGLDPQRAYELVMDLLISRMPGEPWKR